MRAPSAAMSLLAGLFALTVPVLAADDAREKLAAVTKKVSQIEVYGVKASVVIFESPDRGDGSRAFQIEAWRDGDQFAYRNGPIEVIWGRRKNLVVNHVSRRI